MHRLTPTADFEDHRRRTRNTLSVATNVSVALISVGVYTGKDEDLFNDSLEITFDRATTCVSIWDENALLATAEVTMTTEEAKVAAKEPGRSLEDTHEMFFKRPIVLVAGRMYDIEHTVHPTDVVNHYSGWPITQLGAELWTCYGVASASVMASGGVTFTFADSSRGGRSCLWQGQLPFVRFWTL